ncbi:hypothetical protein IAT40_005315 [Kwoniella sp. CBS 6097]
MVREARFYQEAYEASGAYMSNIGKQLSGRFGFRIVTERDVAIHQPFVISSSDQPLLLNLIASTSTPSGSVQVHIVQLPAQLSAFFDARGNSDARSPLSTHPRLTTFSTLLTPTACHITQKTLDIPLLNDLISFLQCLLPSSTALALTATPSLFAQHSSREIDENGEELVSVSAMSATLDEVLCTPRLAAYGRQDERTMDTDTMSRIDAWRLTSTGDANENREDKPVVPCEGAQLTQDDNIMEIETVRSMMSTPSADWVDKNEDMSRDAAGCSYFRRLKETTVAEQVTA